MAPRCLIIGCGNPLRSDDGVAWHAAAALRQEVLVDQVTIICVHQLMPELAEDVSRVDTVIFLDAAAVGEPGYIACGELQPSEEAAAFSHHLSPGQLLSLCRIVYGRSPRAFAVSLAGESFDHGDKLSSVIERKLGGLVEIVEGLIASPTHPTSPGSVALYRLTASDEISNAGEVAP